LLLLQLLLLLLLLVTIAEYDMLPRLALMTTYIGNSTFSPADGSNLTAVGPASSGCTRSPSVKLTGSVTLASPGTGGWCGGNSSSTLAATGVHNLSQTGAPKGTLFSHFECYNIASGTAGPAVNGSSITLQANDVWTCVAGERKLLVAPHPKNIK
jgi:hypothetical protein